MASIISKIMAKPIVINIWEKHYIMRNKMNISALLKRGRKLSVVNIEGAAPGGENEKEHSKYGYTNVNKYIENENGRKSHEMREGKRSVA